MHGAAGLHPRFRISPDTLARTHKIPARCRLGTISSLQQSAYAGYLACSIYLEGTYLHVRERLNPAVAPVQWHHFACTTVSRLLTPPSYSIPCRHLSFPIHSVTVSAPYLKPGPWLPVAKPRPSSLFASPHSRCRPHPSSPTVVSDHAVGSNSSRINSAPPLPILDHDSLVYLHRPVPTLGLRTPITVSPFARRAGEGNFAVHKPERTGFAGEWNAGWLASRENATLRSNL
ncbi:hypothetical protein PMIN07_009908 [Paraphaeosphaeria minitans]